MKFRWLLFDKAESYTSVINFVFQIVDNCYTVTQKMFPSILTRVPDFKQSSKWKFLITGPNKILEIIFI